ncbi:MAG: hypothetical protein ACREMK_06000 [Gemmatimonadota bacterium]
MKRMIPFVLLFAILACESPAGPPPGPPLEREPTLLRISVLEEVAEAGGTVTVRLENLSDLVIGYNLCVDRHVERWIGEWVDRRLPQEGFCPGIMITLAPGSEVTYEHQVPAGLQPGIYRFDFGDGIDFELPVNRLPDEDRKTNSFRVGSS